MSLKHFVADLAVKSFYIFVIARNVLLQCISPIECFRTDVTDEVSFIQMALFLGKFRGVSS